MSSYKKPDFWSLKAQKEGYPARSVYKLQEIDKKFAFFISSRGKSGGGGTGGLRALDLGAAPGSWSLYILRRYGSRGPGNQAEHPAKGAIDPAADPAAGLPEEFFLAAADLLPLPRRHDRGLFDRRDFFFVQGDFTANPVREELVRRGPYTAVVSDAAPATTGNRSVDTPRSLALAEEALGCAEQCLAPGGNFAVKVFQGDTAAFLGRLRESFTTVKSFKPAACRSGSFETYYIGLGKKGYTHSR
ncbi:MAG: RlmE family RNA methyltransferase [Spirochaetaceae bacterium]|jgi:23S rRNA (uridine2552-2'-O)-methyltransferase|nr:RlmE family RNA methyltransferase [Spirochaetaceae bacterium]